MAGFSLLEAVLSVGLLSVVVLGAMAAFGSVATVSSPDPMREAAEREMRRIVTLESAAAKYSDPTTAGINPAAWSTSMPSPAGTPIPITVSAKANASAPSGAPQMSVTIAYPGKAGPLSMTKALAIVRKAPAPQSAIAAPGTYADPNTAATP